MKVGWLRPLLGVLLVVLVGGLTALAYASPPDPSWIQGIYDGADYDDVVSMITLDSEATTAILSADVGRLPVAVPLPPPPPPPLVTHAVVALQSRAPPAISLPR